MKVNIFLINSEEYFTLLIPLAMCVLSLANIVYYMLFLYCTKTKKYANNIVFILIECFIFEQVIQHCTLNSLFLILFLNLFITFLSMYLLSVLADTMFCYKESCIKSTLNKKTKYRNKGSYIYSKKYMRGLILAYIMPIIFHLINVVVYIVFEEKVKILFPGYKPLEYLFISFLNVVVYIYIQKYKCSISCSLIMIESILFYLFTIPFMR